MEKLRRFWRGLRHFITRHWLGVGLTSIGAIVMTPVLSQVVVENFNEARSGPAEYKVLVVGGKANADGRKDFAHHMKEAIEETWKKSKDLVVDGKPVMVEYREDNWEPDKAEEISEQLAERDDVVLVIGHFASSTTKKALKNYLRADPPIPVILTTETNPHLLPESRDKDRHPVFRLWPTDQKQAEAIVEFATSNRRVFWVVEDRSPQIAVYSHYLAEEIVKSLQRAGKKVILWSDNQNIPSASTLQSLKIDAVIFPGMASSALILVSQLREIWQEIPDIFLTDASMDSPILKNSEHLTTLDGVYVSHPALIACKPISSIKGTLSETGELAADAAKIAKTIIERASDDVQTPFLSGFFASQDVRDLRRAVVQEMARPNSYPGVGEKEYKFEQDGVDKNVSFKLWRILNRQFVPVDKPCVSLPIEASVVETWVQMLLGNLESNREIIVKKFSLLRAAAVLTGKVLAERAVSDQDLLEFAGTVTDTGSYFEQTTVKYFTDLHHNAVELQKIKTDLAQHNLDATERNNLTQKKESLWNWFNGKSLELTKLFKQHLDSLSSPNVFRQRRENGTGH